MSVATNAGVMLPARYRRVMLPAREELDLGPRLPADAGWRERLRVERRSRMLVPAAVAVAYVRRRAAWRWARDEELRKASRRRIEAVVAGTSRAGAVEHLARAAALEDAAAVELLRRHRRLCEGRRRQGEAHLRDARRTARGVLVSYCHLGPFQGASSAVLATLGRAPWLFVGTWLDQPPGVGLSGRHVERWRELQRRAGARCVTTVPGDTLTRGVELLRRGEVACFLFDVRGSTDTMWLGKPVALATGTARMAHAADALVVPMVCSRRRGTVTSRFLRAVDPRDFPSPDALHRRLADVHGDAILADPAAFEDPYRLGAWETGAGPSRWSNPAKGA